MVGEVYAQWTGLVMVIIMIGIQLQVIVIFGAI